MDALLDYAIIEGKMHERMASKTRDLPEVKQTNN